MRILIWHGAQLRGTVSSTYIDQLARALAAQGHDVTIACPGSHAGDSDSPDRFVGVRSGGETIDDRANAGTCTVVQLDVGDQPAVDVHDAAPKANAFVSMTDTEVEGYISANVIALRRVANRCSPQIVLTSEVACSTAISRRAALGVPYYCHIHGSAFEELVKCDRRFFNLAVEGLTGAEAIFVGSHYIRTELERLFAGSGADIADKIRLMPCGVDVEIFRLDANRQSAVQQLSQSLAAFDPGKALQPDLMEKLESLAAGRSRHVLESCIAETRSQYDDALPEAPFIEKGLSFNPALRDPETVNIYFLGKLIPQKGLHNLILGFAELVASGSKVSLTITAFGKYREHYELMLQALSAGGRNLLDTVLSTDPYFEPARNYYAKQDDAYFRRIASAHPRSRVFFTGRLDHQEIVRILPFMDLIVTPSVIPEAFGMVAIEGMACGVLSAVTNSSALADVATAAEGYLDEPTMQLIRLNPSNGIGDLRRKLPGLVAKARSMTNEDREKLRRIVVEQFSWGKIAEKFLEYVATDGAPVVGKSSVAPGLRSPN